MTISYEELLKTVNLLTGAKSQYDISRFLSIRYRYDEDLLGAANPERYLRLIGGGRVDASAPFTLSIQPSRTVLILFSLQGSGRLSLSQSAQALGSGSIFLFPCTASFQLSSSLLPWSFRLFFAAGPDLENYLPFLGSPFMTTEQSSPFMASAAEELASLPENVSLPSLLRTHRLLTDMLSDACLLALPKEPFPRDDIPSYLRDFHAYIHDCRNVVFSLARFEALYGISRYRLCREYGAVYRVSPLKDFNRVRIREAKKLLLNTHLQVQEISSRLGYDNTNHFIRLFKAETGLTPGAYRAQSHQ